MLENDLTNEITSLLDKNGIDYLRAFDTVNTQYVFRIDWCDMCGDYLKAIYVKGSCVSVEHSYLTPVEAICKL